MSLARSLGVLLLLAACGENPSYTLRWRIVGEDGTSPPLTSIRQCTEVGIGEVRIHTRDPGGVPIDVRDVPCFPSAFTDESARFDGPELEPGEYEVLIEGVRRSGGTWEGVMSTPQTLSVTGKAPISLDELRLPAPPECDDGVDNDHDGAVDSADPGCTLEPPSESNDINSAQFFVHPTFFDHDANVGCGDVDVDAFEVVVTGVFDGAPYVSPVQRFPCGLTSYGFRTLLDPGAGYVVDVTAVRTVDGVNYAAVTSPSSHPFDVAEDQGNYVLVDADFAAGDFLTPIESPISFVLGYEPFPGGASRGCAPIASEGTLTLDTVTIAVVDGQGAVISPPVLLESGEPLDGVTPLPCPISVLRTEPLTWGEFALVVNAAEGGGAVCWASPAPIRAAPGSTFTVTLPRSSSADACADCSTDAECGGGGTCDESSICR
ncbi:MAG: hypothetical protein R3B09_27350, partial [Nannocystaceae bacterium]